MEPTLHLARPKDLGLLIGFVRQLYTHDRIPFSEPILRTALETLIRDPSLGGVWLLRLASATAACLVLTFGFSLEAGGRDACSDELFVAEQHRGRGLGGVALRFAEQTCRERGIGALHREVDRVNTEAQRRCRRSGFVDHDRCLMTKPLAG